MGSKISIIMGAYDCAPTLCESLDSIVNQTYSDWEFIICDDGSTDETLNILMEYKKKYPEKFKIIKNKTNLGLNATLNNCLKIAKGEYIARQDGDDISVVDRFEKEVAFLDSHPEFAFVSSNMDFFDESGVWGTWKNAPTPQREDFLKHSPCFCHAPCMIRREAFLEVKGYTVKERYLRCEDVNLWYKLYAKGYKGYNLQESLYLMRDDHNAYKRRTIKNRINIILTEWDGMKSLHFSFLDYRYFAVKVIRNFLLALMPEKLYKFLHGMRLKQG